jgi:hypothetical protein
MFFRRVTYWKTFYGNSKDGADTYIRLHLTTTDDPVDFTVRLKFVWESLDGGNLEILA